MSDNLPKESFLGIVKIGTSKTAEALQEIIQKFLETKKLDISNIKFIGLDRWNERVSGERKVTTLYTSPSTIQYILKL